MGLAALWHVGSSQTRDWTHGPAVAGRFLTTGPPTSQPLATLTNQAHRTLHLFFIYLKCLKFSRLDMMVRLQLECTVHLCHLSGQFHCQKQTTLYARQSFHFYCKDKKNSLMVAQGIRNLSGEDDPEWYWFAKSKTLATWNMNLSQGLGTF